MADSILSAFMQMVFEKLASPMVDEFGLAHGIGIQTKLKKLSRILASVRAVINDAEQRQIQEESVSIWLKELQEVAYDADDIIDEMSTEALRSRSQVSNIFSLFNPKHIVYRFQIGSKIDEVIDNLENIAKEKEHLHLREGTVVSSSNKVGRIGQTSSLVEEHGVFGRICDKERLVSLLLSESDQETRISVVPVVGMGGIGKSTLAQLVYNDKEVESHFELRMWICVVDGSDMKLIIKAIIESATGAKFDLLDMDPMQRHLQRVIMEKKYLLVLDDVWIEDISEWDMLRVPLNAGAHGSKILVTTRSEVVSSLMGTIPAYSVKGLSHTDGWLLFKSRAFRHSDSHVLQNLEQISKRIVIKCQGLPLALKGIGDLLNSVTDENQWSFVSESGIWELPQDRINIFQQLGRSYLQLPTHLKRCFGYCSIFPRDHLYNKESLVLLWMAQGFTPPKGIKQLEDIGNDDFDDLLGRSLFHLSHIDPIDDEPRYLMHGLIHDLLQLVTHDDCVSMNASMVSSSISKKFRHASVTCDIPQPFDLKVLNEFTKVRSLLLFGAYKDMIKEIPHDFFLKLKSLRALDLSHTSITELPGSIGNSKHLRFLDLSWTCIQGLPDTIGSVCNLQTLNLKKCLELRTLPDTMSSLINLRHFSISSSTALLRILPFYNRRFLDLPKRIKNLINIRDIDTSLGTSFQNILPFAERKSCLDSLSRMISSPPGMGRLMRLQSLSNYVLTKRDGCGVEELKHLVNLRGSLCISKLENVRDEHAAKEADMKTKHRLCELTLNWSEESLYISQHRALAWEVIEFLQPHENLKGLRIVNFAGQRLPSWLSCVSLFNLVSICLFNCQNCESLPSLWQFPSLKNVKIHGFHALTNIDHDFYGSGGIFGFPSLETLEMKDMPNLELWSGAYAGHMTCLRELTIWDCPKLKDIPNFASDLVVLEVANCKGICSLPMISSIQSLVIGRCNEMVLNSLPYITALTSLNISGLSRLKYLPDGVLDCLTSLRTLNVVDCDKLTFLTLVGSLWKLSSLERLDICTCPRLTTLKNELLPANLKSLRLVSCQNLTELPQKMDHLLALQYFEAWNCSQLLYLPETKLPMNLQRFWIRKCPRLEELCSYVGADWDKICHIPNIRIDLEWIQQS